MAKVLIVYFSRGGNTGAMAEAVRQGAAETGGDCQVQSVAEASVDALPDCDALILGSPTYYGAPAAEIKTFIDESVRYHGKLGGKVGGAFASCGVEGGGVETTVRALLDALLIHGMVVQGTAHGPHYGPVAVGKPNDAALRACRELGKRVAALAAKVRA